MLYWVFLYEANKGLRANYCIESVLYFGSVLSTSMVQIICSKLIAAESVKGFRSKYLRLKKKVQKSIIMQVTIEN